MEVPTYYKLLFRIGHWVVGKHNKEFTQDRFLFVAKENKASYPTVFTKIRIWDFGKK